MQSTTRLGKQCNVKTAMAKKTSCEPSIEEVDLSKCKKTIENKQKFTCLDDSDKLKIRWSEENHIKQSTRTAQPCKKSGKRNGACSFVEGVAASRWDAGAPLTKNEL